MSYNRFWNCLQLNDKKLTTRFVNPWHEKENVYKFVAEKQINYGIVIQKINHYISN